MAAVAGVVVGCAVVFFMARSKQVQSFCRGIRDRYLLSRGVDLVCGNLHSSRKLQGFKMEMKEVVRECVDQHGPGDILEIGIGSGNNFCIYPDNTELIAVDQNPDMHKYLVRNTEREAHPRGIRIKNRLVCGAEDMHNIPDDSVIVAVCTMVLCSVTSQERVLKEVHRVLKPEGYFIFIEHVAEDQGTMTRRFQELIKALWHALCDCNLARETWKVLEDSELTRVQYRFFRIPSGIGLVDRYIAGHAQKENS